MATLSADASVTLGNENIVEEDDYDIVRAGDTLFSETC